MKLLRFTFMSFLLAFILTGCNSQNNKNNNGSQASNFVDDPKYIYNSMISEGNELSIVRELPALDLNLSIPAKLYMLPTFNKNLGNPMQVDLKSRDLEALDLNGRSNDLLNSYFDTKTIWPSVLPEGFNPQKILELGKNPGLGMRELHNQGVTGNGVSVAVIGLGLLVNHIEYKDNLKLYEEIHCNSVTAYDSASPSILVGKTVGVAPGADLYYVASTLGTYMINSSTNKKIFADDLSYLAQSIDRIVAINKTLPQNNKIRVISFYLHITNLMKNFDQANESINKAKQEGIYTIYPGSDKIMGLGRESTANPDDISSFCLGRLWTGNSKYENDNLLVPVDSRAFASATGPNEYTYYRYGYQYMSTEYVAGLYALACQVYPEITPEIFWQKAFSTSDTINLSKSDQLGKIVNPAKLIASLKQ